MNYIKFFSIVLIMLLAVEDSHSQQLNRDNYKARAQKNVEGMKNGLKLSDTQVKEIARIEEHFFVTLLAPDRDSAQMEVKAVKLAKLQKEKEEAMQKVLTPEQWNQYVSYLTTQQKKNEAAIEDRKRSRQTKSGQ